jgi:phycocyanobilin lyase alpha subunit
MDARPSLNEAGSAVGVNASSAEPAYTIEKAIAHLQQTDDPSLRYYAAWWIGRFRVREPVAIATLVDALYDESDRSPDGGYPLRRNAAKALGKVGDSSVVPALITALACEDYYVRESVAQSLEMLGDRRAVVPLMQLLAGGLEQAQRVVGKPHLVQPYEAIIEALGTLGAKEAIPAISPFLEHFLEKIQYAAARAMYQLTGNAQYGERLVMALKGLDLQLRRSALMDLGSSGYLEGAEVIAQTYAENSLKLVAMKGLLEGHLQTYQEINPDLLALSEQSHRLMALMDQLL